MNQIMPVGNGVLIAIEQNISHNQLQTIIAAWKERAPDIPVFIIPNAQIVREGDLNLFQFTGDITPTFVAEFQRWWEGVAHG